MTAVEGRSVSRWSIAHNLLLRQLCSRMVQLTDWYNDDEQQDDDAHDQTSPHLHVLPPHLLADSVGTPPEALSADRQIIRLVLERVQALAPLRDLVDVLAHNADGVVNLLKGVKRASQPELLIGKLPSGVVCSKL